MLISGSAGDSTIPQDAQTTAEDLPVTPVEQAIGDLACDRTDDLLAVNCLLDAFSRGQLRIEVLTTDLDPEGAGRGAARRNELLRTADLGGGIHGP